LAFDAFCTIDNTRSDTWMMKNITDLEPEDIEARFRKMKSKANSLRNQFELMKIDNGNKPAAFAKKIFYDL
jgi:hypothetical protein